MKILLYIIGLTFSQSIFGQIIYKPTFINQCTKKPVEDIFWMISDSTKMYGNEYYGMPTATLPKLGGYKLVCPSVSEAPINITISSNATVKDTFFIRRLDYIIYIESKISNKNTPHIPPKYFLCSPDSLANGTLSDYYRNGKKREEGTFQNGKLIDTLSIYYRSGELYKLVCPNIEEFKITKYSIDGQIIE